MSSLLSDISEAETLSSAVGYVITNLPSLHAHLSLAAKLSATYLHVIDSVNQT
jgi:hypothetical protein